MGGDASIPREDLPKTRIERQAPSKQISMGPAKGAVLDMALLQLLRSRGPGRASALYHPTGRRRVGGSSEAKLSMLQVRRQRRDDDRSKLERDERWCLAVSR
jgi:hypothetical protein